MRLAYLNSSGEILDLFDYILVKWPNLLYHISDIQISNILFRSVE